MKQLSNLCVLIFSSIWHIEFLWDWNAWFSSLSAWLHFCNFPFIYDNMMQLQSKQIEVRLCSAYAQVLCTGIGSIWVCYFLETNFVRVISRWFLSVYAADWSFRIIWGQLSNPNFYTGLQILEDAIWKDLDWSDLKVNTEPDSAIYQHVRNRTVENVSKFLEMRTNSNGYGILPQA